ncbi:hypothetical protein Tco_0471110 [Tanacetum coccineum]
MGMATNWEDKKSIHNEYEAPLKEEFVVREMENGNPRNGLDSKCKNVDKVIHRYLIIQKKLCSRYIQRSLVLVTGLGEWEKCKCVKALFDYFCLSQIDKKNQRLKRQKKVQPERSGHSSPPDSESTSVSIKYKQMGNEEAMSIYGSYKLGKRARE